LPDKNVFNCFLSWQRLSDDRGEAGSLFQSRGPATSNDLSPRRVLYHSMTHVMASGERRRRLDSGANLYVSERYDGAQPCSDLNISVASLKSTRRRTGSQCNSCSTDCRGVASTCITLRVLVVHAALDNDRGLLILPVMSKTATVDWSAVVQSRPKECVIALLYQLDYQLRREHCMLPRCQ